MPSCLIKDFRLLSLVIAVTEVGGDCHIGVDHTPAARVGRVFRGGFQTMATITINGDTFTFPHTVTQAGNFVVGFDDNSDTLNFTKASNITLTGGAGNDSLLADVPGIDSATGRRGQRHLGVWNQPRDRFRQPRQRLHLHKRRRPFRRRPGCRHDRDRRVRPTHHPWRHGHRFHLHLRRQQPHPGGTGNDTIFSSDGNHTILGGLGDDSIEVDNGAGDLDGRRGQRHDFRRRRQFHDRWRPW